MGWSIDAYLWNKSQYTHFANVSSKKRPYDYLWQKDTQIGGSGWCRRSNNNYPTTHGGWNNEPPIYLDIWTTWVINGWLTFKCQIYYMPKDGGTEVYGGQASGWIAVNKNYSSMNAQFSRRTFSAMSGYCWTISLSNFLNKLIATGSSNLDATALAVGATFDNRLADRYRIVITAIEKWTDNKNYTYGPWTFYLTYLPTEITNATISNAGTEKFCLMFDAPFWLNYTSSFAFCAVQADNPSGSGKKLYNPKGYGASAEMTLLPDEYETSSSIVLSTETSNYTSVPSWTEDEEYYVELLMPTNHIGSWCNVDGKPIQVYPLYKLSATADDIGDMDAPGSIAVRNENGGVTVYVEATSTSSLATSATVTLDGGFSDEIITKELDGESIKVPWLPVTDLTDTTWYFNDDIEPYGDINSEPIYINFLSPDDPNENEWTYLVNNPLHDYTGIHWSGMSYHVYSTLAHAYKSDYYGQDKGWTEEYWRTIVISGGDDATNADFIAWLKNNATQIDGPNMADCVAFEFPYAPRKDCTFTIVAEDAYNRVSTSYLSAADYGSGILSKGITVMGMDGSNVLHAFFDIEVSESPEADTVEVQLNGRSRPSVFWGETGKHDRNIKFDIPWNSPIDSVVGTQKEQIKAWREAPFNGVHIVFLPDGERVIAQISDLSIERNYLEDRTASVSFKVVEVDA